MTAAATPVSVIMQDEKYASIGQLINLARQSKYAEMEYLLKNFNYSRFAISLHRKQLVSNDTPRAIAEIVLDYHESAMSNL